MAHYSRISPSSISTFKSDRSPRFKQSDASNKSSTGEEIYRNLDADKLLNEIGQYGTYQIIAYILCELLNFFYSSSLFIMPFIQMKPDNFECPTLNESERILAQVGDCKRVLHTSNGGLTDKNNSRNSQSVSDDISWSNDRSILVEFDLLCSSPVIQEAGFCVFSLGAMIIVPFTSQLADLYGRRLILLIMLYFSVLFNILAAFAPNYAIFVFLRFLIGATSDSYLTIAAILSCEVVANESRPWTGLIYTIAWLLGYLYAGMLTQFIETWRKLYLMMALPGILTIIYLFLLPESPYWMLAHGRTKGIRKYIHHSNWINRETINLNDCCVDEEIAKKSQRIKRRTIWDILKWKRILFHIFTNGFITMIMCFYYFAISFDSVNLSADKITGFMLSGAIELPGGILAIPLLRFFGRRSVSIFALIFQGIATLISPFVRKWRGARMTCDLFGKMINGVGFVAHPLLVNEMMPTTIRTISYSIVNIPQSIGIMLSPLLKHTDIGDGMIPCLTLAVLSFMSAICAATLPETKHKPMPEDFDQMDVGPLLRRFIRRPMKTRSSKEDASPVE
uniref:Major facilitator superfamily (MFS) profile domain-containing protein n=2 Tax=Parascaris univalens TaxID=6257 RepID=A0A915C5N8_PARUN